MIARILAFAPLALMLFASCASPSAQPSPATAVPRANVPKRVTAIVWNDPSSLLNRMNQRPNAPGAVALEQLILSGLSENDPNGNLQPLLADAVPSLENGLWQVQPDGRMDTTWHIRPGTVWHDGVPFTADDLVFTTTVDQDPDLPIPPNAAYRAVASVAAVDSETVVVHWSRPYIYANAMFGSGSSGIAFASPLPKHLLEGTYLQDKTSFQSLPYWNQQYVGTGPFKVQEFVPGSHVSLVANEQYVVGRPKIDQLEVRFSLDLDTMIANLLTGDVDLNLGRGFSTEHAVDMRQRWPQGDVRIFPNSWIVIFPQFIDASPAVVDDVRFRKALIYATDRQQLVDELEGGLTQVADVFLAPTEPEYQDVASQVVRYAYDPRQAGQMVEQLGYARATDGFYRDSSGQALSLEMRTYGAKISDQASVSVADMWTQFGIQTEPVIVPPQRYLNDREYMATFPSFLMYRQPDTSSVLQRSVASQVPTADNKFVGSNYARYQNPEFNSLINRFYVTIPTAERTSILGQIMYHISDQLNMMGLFYDTEIMFVNQRLQNVYDHESGLSNIPQWDVVS